MPDKLDLDKATFVALMPEQRLMAAIILRAVADLPFSSRFFQTDNGRFQLCCEALRMDPDEVRALIERSSNRIEKGRGGLLLPRLIETLMFG